MLRPLRFHSNLSRSLTLPENSLLGPDVSLQLGGSDVDADGLRQVADGLRHHGFGCVAGLQARRLQPNVFTLVSRDDAFSNKSLRAIVNMFFFYSWEHYVSYVITSITIKRTFSLSFFTSVFFGEGTPQNIRYKLNKTKCFGQSSHVRVNY